MALYNLIIGEIKLFYISGKYIFIYCKNQYFTLKFKCVFLFQNPVIFLILYIVSIYQFIYSIVQATHSVSVNYPSKIVNTD